MSHSERRLARLWRETRTSSRLALPLALGQLAAMAMSVVDSVLAGRHGPVTLAAVAVGGALWTEALLICIGVMMAVPTSVAHLNGAGRRSEIAPLWRQAMWLALGMGVGLQGFVWLSPALLPPFGIAIEVRPQATDFLHMISFSAPALAMYLACRNVSEGIAWTKPTMVFGVAGLVALIPLGYALMFGFGPIPELGAAGLGLATTLVVWLQLAGFLIYLRCSKHFSDLALFARFDRPDVAKIRDLLRLGLPMGVSVFMEGSLFVVTALLAGGLGTVDVAAHQIALNVISACFMLPLGVAMATTVRVGHAAGADDMSAVRWATAAGLVIVLLIQTAAAALLVFAGHWITPFYTQDKAVAALAVTLMLYAAIFQYPDGIQVLSSGALRGLKDTRVPMFITTFAYWCVGIPLGAWFGLHQQLRTPGLWIGLILGLGVAALLLASRLWRLTHRPDRVMT